MTRRCVLVGPLLLVVAGGCTAPFSRGGFASRQIAAAPDEVFRTAQAVMRREFGRIHVDAQRREIRCEPVEFDTTRESGTARDLYGAPSTMRRVAWCRIEPRGDGSVARVRVVLERQDTRRTEAFRQDEYRLTDAPARTAIERDAATTPEQNTVWTFVRRDHSTERALLRQIQDAFAPLPGEAPASAPSGP